MPLPTPHLDVSTIDLSHVVEDQESIRQILPQRYEMEMLTAIVHLDTVNHLIVGYKDVKSDEFWARGHFPNHPVFPGVLMCEAAAQLSGYYSIKTKVSQDNLIGLGALEEATFRRVIRPGDRLVLVGKGLKMNRRMTVFDVHGYVDSNLAFHMIVKGVSLGRLEDL